jgi:hypothetical protein
MGLFPKRSSAELLAAHGPLSRTAPCTEKKLEMGAKEGKSTDNEGHFQ